MSIPRLDTLARRMQLRLLSKSATGRARLLVMLESSERALAALDKIQATHTALPDPTPVRTQLQRNIAAVQRVLSKVAA